MSYDLHFVPTQSGVDAASSAEASLATEELGINLGPLDPAKEARKRAIAADLIAADPVLSVYPFDFQDLARIEGITEPEARVRFRHLELNGPEDGNGIQITLFDDSASLTVPYWHDGSAAETVWDEIWSCVAVLEQHGFATYDPQLERQVFRHADDAAVAEKYRQGVVFTRGVATELIRPPKRPWWKFWSPGA
jgi:hypothetical protein